MKCGNAISEFRLRKTIARIMLQGDRGPLMDFWRETWSYVQPTLALFGGVAVLCTTLAAAAYGLFRLTAEKWLQAKFDERLAAYKHEQQKELEGLKFRIARLMDRATKFHQREFEVLPEAWARLNEMYARTVSFVAAVQSYPNLDDMSLEHLEEFVSQCKLQNWQKDELKQSTNKNEYYRKNIFWYYLTHLREDLQDLHLYVLKNSILMPKNIRAKFMQIEQLISNAIIEREFNHAGQFVPHKREDAKSLLNEGELLKNELETAIEDRLSSLESIQI